MCHLRLRTTVLAVYTNMPGDSALAVLFAQKEKKKKRFFSFLLWFCGSSAVLLKPGCTLVTWGALKTITVLAPPQYN